MGRVGHRFQRDKPVYPFIYGYNESATLEAVTYSFHRACPKVAFRPAMKACLSASLNWAAGCKRR